MAARGYYSRIFRNLKTEAWKADGEVCMTVEMLDHLAAAPFLLAGIEGGNIGRSCRPPLHDRHGGHDRAVMVNYHMAFHKGRPIPDGLPQCAVIQE